MKQLIKKYKFGGITAAYVTDESRAAELVLLPESKENDIVIDKPGKVDSLVQLMIEGDGASPGFAAGHTYRNSRSVDGLYYVN